MNHQPPAVRAILDTRDNKIFYSPGCYSVPEIVGIEEFVAHLNKKAKTDRYTIVTMAPLYSDVKVSAGVPRQYAAFMKASPLLRIQAEINEIRDGEISIAPRNGQWVIHHVHAVVGRIAYRADVPDSQARQALWEHLQAQLGEVMHRVHFPWPETHHTSRPDEASDDASAQP